MVVRAAVALSGDQLRFQTAGLQIGGVPANQFFDRGEVALRNDRALTFNGRPATQEIDAIFQQVAARRQAEQPARFEVATATEVAARPVSFSDQVLQERANARDSGGREV